MLLNNGNINVRRLLGGDAAAKAIFKIAVGTSATEVNVNDTAITNALVKNIDDINYLAGGIVEFRATLEAADPEMTIQEVGLMDENNVLLHRKVIAPRLKTAGVTASVYYRVKIH